VLQCVAIVAVRCSALQLLQCVAVVAMSCGVAKSLESALSCRSSEALHKSANRLGAFARKIANELT